jgi:hypothetical protein
MRRAVSAFSALLAFGLSMTPAHAGAIVAAPFDSVYTLTDLGPIAGLPQPYGGLNFYGNTNTLLIGGDANDVAGLFYTVPVTRDVSGHIIGFGSATPLGSIGSFNDGGVAYGPGGVLFYAQWPINQISEVKPGDTSDDKIVDASALGIASSTAALNFVPAGFGGAGRFKVSTWAGGEFYDVTLSPDGSGTFDLTSATQMATLPGGPEGFIYVPIGSPLFPGQNLLISEFSAGNVAAYQVDANGDPIVATRQDFITGLTGAEGALIDPVTGDFLFSTFGTGTDSVFEVQGFVPPPPSVPEPVSAIFVFAGLGVLAARRLRWI